MQPSYHFVICFNHVHQKVLQQIKELDIDVLLLAAFQGLWPGRPNFCRDLLRTKLELRTFALYFITCRPLEHLELDFVTEAKDEPRCSCVVFKSRCARAHRLRFTALPATRHIIESAREQADHCTFKSSAETDADTGKSLLSRHDLPMFRPAC